MHETFKAVSAQIMQADARLQEWTVVCKTELSVLKKHAAPIGDNIADKLQMIADHVSVQRMKWCTKIADTPVRQKAQEINTLCEKLGMASVFESLSKDGAELDLEQMAGIRRSDEARRLHAVGVELDGMFSEPLGLNPQANSHQRYFKFRPVRVRPCGLPPVQHRQPRIAAFM
jgi:hypothetical protein